MKNRENRNNHKQNHVFIHSTCYSVLHDNPVGAMNEVNEQIAKAKPLTEEEVAKRDTLLQQGYPEWKRIDFHAFIRACETFGRKNKKEIVEFLISERREESEIESYYETFWSRYEEIDDYKRFITQYC